MSTTDEVARVVRPVIESSGAELYDVEFNGGILRVSVDRPGGIDMSHITELTRLVSRALDDADPIPSAYTLEVSSPGIERRLRTPEHFAGAVGETVQLKLRAGIDGDRRLLGRVDSVEGDSVTIELSDGGQRRLSLSDITRAQVHIDWDNPPPRPHPTQGNEATQ